MSFNKGDRLYCELCGDCYGELVEDVIPGTVAKAESVKDPEGKLEHTLGFPVRCHNGHRPFLFCVTPEPPRET